MKWLPFVILPLCAGLWAWGAFYGLDLVLRDMVVRGLLVWAGLLAVVYSIMRGAR